MGRAQLQMSQVEEGEGGGCLRAGLGSRGGLRGAQQMSEGPQCPGVLACGT